VAGAAFVVHGHIWEPLALALVLVASIATGAGILGRSEPSWVVAEG
jgi:hypothetical protein